MTMDAAVRTILTFKVEQQRLSDLRTGTDRSYQRIPISEQQPTVAVYPDSREAKVCATVHHLGLRVNTQTSTFSRHGDPSEVPQAPPDHRRH